MAKALCRMVVDHPDRLHEGVADGGADKAEAAALQVFTHRVGDGCGRRDFTLRLFSVDRFPADETPDIGIKAAELLLDGEKGTRVFNSGVDLQPVADNPWIREQLRDLAPVVARDLCRIEIIERGAIIFTLLENCVPTQARLGAFEYEKLEELTVIVQGHTPFVVVVAD